MAVKLEEISGWLDNQDTKHHIDADKIFFGAGDGENNNQSIYIRAREDGNLFELQMQLIDMEDMSNTDIKDHKYLDKLLQHLLFLNYKTKFGTWEYDPSDGDIRLAIEIPFEDAIMTEKQFNRILGYVIRDGSSHAEEIRSIMETGTIPESDDIDAKFAELMRMLKEKIKEEDENDDGI